MIANASRLRRKRSPLASLPGLAVEIDLPGERPVRGNIIDVGDGRVVIDVATRELAKLLAAAGVAHLTVHAPGVRFQATAAPSGSVTGHTVALVIDQAVGHQAYA